MYRNFLMAMKDEGIALTQIGSLLECRYRTVDDTAGGETKKGFYHEDVIAIRNVLFPKYNLDYLFTREK